MRTCWIRGFRGWPVAVFLGLMLSACAHTPPQSLEGEWVLRTLDGNTYDIRIRQLDDRSYYIYQAEGHLTGDYAKERGELVMQESANPRMSDFVIAINNEDSLRITDAPPARLTGVRYTGADIGRPE